MVVGEIMRTHVYSISPEAGLDRALVIMQQQRIRHLPVVEHQKVVGIFSSRDLRLALINEQAPNEAPKGIYLPALTKVRERMIGEVSTVYAHTRIQEAATLMSAKKIGCLPVIDADRKLVGIVTESDMLRLLCKVLEERGE
jgi:acetoin utilization protein AcuB